MTTVRPLTVVIIARDEAARIEACLESVRWADEIVLLDSGSRDDTVAIARRYTDRVYDLEWRGFGLQKQAAVDMASHDMIFSIDCDERLTAELAEEIRGILAKKEIAAAYSVPRRTFLGSKEIRHCGWYPDRTVRLFDRTRAAFSADLVHERVVVQGAVADCYEHLLHYSFSGIAQLLGKLNQYSELGARQLFDKGRRCSLFDLTVRPCYAFFKTYLLRRGFLDGVEGLEIAATTSLLTFVKYIKLREMERSK